MDLSRGLREGAESAGVSRVPRIQKGGQARSWPKDSLLGRIQEQVCFSGSIVTSCNFPGAIQAGFQLISESIWIIALGSQE